MGGIDRAICRGVRYLCGEYDVFFGRIVEPRAARIDNTAIRGAAVVGTLGGLGFRLDDAQDVFDDIEKAVSALGDFAREFLVARMAQRAEPFVFQ
jgi:hypothetical protein